MAIKDGTPALFVEEPPTFTIEDDGIAQIQVTSGDQQLNIRCTPHVLLAGSARAMRAYVEWDAKRQEPQQIKGG